MELLIRTVDKGAGEDQSKEGDVIAICPDGWAWSEAERTNPEWLLIKAEILPVEADALTAGPSDPSLSTRRKFRVDTTGLTPGDVLTRDSLAARVFLT